jgi:hypothetical protein
LCGYFEPFEGHKISRYTLRNPTSFNSCQTKVWTPNFWTPAKEKRNPMISSRNRISFNNKVWTSAKFLKKREIRFLSINITC